MENSARQMDLTTNVRHRYNYSRTSRSSAQMIKSYQSVLCCTLNRSSCRFLPFELHNGRASVENCASRASMVIVAWATD